MVFIIICACCKIDDSVESTQLIGSCAIYAKTRTAEDEWSAILWDLS